VLCGEQHDSFSWSHLPMLQSHPSPARPGARAVHRGQVIIGIPGLLRKRLFLIASIP